ncbi:MAG TPA: hypothetical protein VFA60_01845 [Terriglobales bacterium]|nr:hypothetical protein [Terriglobales bacterium]
MTRYFFRFLVYVVFAGMPGTLTLQAQTPEFPPDIQAPASANAPATQQAPPQAAPPAANTPAAEPSHTAPAAAAGERANPKPNALPRATAHATTRKGKAKTQSGAASTAALDVPPPPPPTPAQMPPTRPQVSYRDGLLFIDAQNSTMADVLSAVRNRTGVAIDVPPVAAGERVFFHAAPGSVRDVLASLLTGSRFNFVILGSERSADAVQRVIVTQRAPEGGAQQPLPAFGDGSAQGDNQDAEIPDREIEDNAPQPQPAAPAGANADRPQFPPMPLGQSQGGQQPNAQQPGAQTPTNTPQQPKTPEQLLEELKKMQQQQQQQQNQQKPPQ